MKSETTILKGKITREINALQSYINDIKEAHKQQGNNNVFWYFGNKLSVHNINEEESNLRVLQIKRNRLNNL